MAFTFSEVWNTLFENTPADIENVSLGAGRIRSLKVDIHERLAIDHSWNGDSNDGKHKQVTLRLAGPGPSVLDATDGLLFVNAQTGRSELYYQDDAQNITQITKSGQVAIVNFAPGTTLPFIQSAAPTGWIQSTNFNDRVLRATNGLGAGNGGAWNISGLAATTVVAGHALSTFELPSHTHNVNAETASGGTIGFNAGNSFFLSQLSITSDGGTGGNGAHTHGATTNVSGDGSWRPAYVDTIVCVKQ